MGHRSQDQSSSWLKSPRRTKPRTSKAKNQLVESMPITQNQIKAYLETVKAIAGAIKELKQVPSGHLYAQLMSHMSIDTYNSIIEVLKKARVIKESSHLITWIAN